MDKTSDTTDSAALVFAGGMGLGAYQAGAFEKLQKSDAHPFRVNWLLGSSVGAVNAALITGNPPEQRIARLREFWSQPDMLGLRPLALPAGGRYVRNWVSALQARLIGARGHFRPRAPGFPFEDFKSLYDLAPMRRTIDRLVDFGRLNSSEVRLTVAATDIESGETALFDTQREELTVDHLLASCGMLPEFAPVMIEGRLYGDGGLSANAPVEPALTEKGTRLVFVVDLFARAGGRPRSLAASLARKNELMFGNQTLRLLGFWRDTLGGRSDKRVVYLSYTATPDEADAEKLFDLSAATVEQRWLTGAQDMELGLTRLRAEPAPPLVIIRDR